LFDAVRRSSAWRDPSIRGVVRDLQSALRVPGFGRLAATYSLNGITEWMATVALAILVWDQTHDPFATTALFVAAKFLPAFVVPALSARLDGLPVARVLVGIYVVEAALLAGLALQARLYFLPVLLVLAFADGTLAAVARAVTRAATVSVLQPADKLREGNAVLNLGSSVGMLGGPALAGFAVALVGVGPVLLATGAGFAGLALLIIGARNVAPVEAEPAPWTTRLREATGYVLAHRMLMVLLGGQALMLLMLTMTEPIEVVYVKDTLGGGDAGLGALLTAWGSGLALGSAVFARVRNQRMVVLIPASTLLMAVGYLGLAAAPTLLAACAIAVVGGLGNGVQWVSVVTAIQEATEEKFQARVAGLFEALVAGAPGLGFLLGGLVTALLSPRAAFAIAGGGVVVLLLVGSLVLRRSIPRDPSVLEPVAEPLPEAA
jgi:MFS family permease